MCARQPRHDRCSALPRWRVEVTVPCGATPARVGARRRADGRAHGNDGRSRTNRPAGTGPAVARATSGRAGRPTGHLSGAGDDRAPAPPPCLRRPATGSPAAGRDARMPARRVRASGGVARSRPPVRTISRPARRRGPAPRSRTRSWAPSIDPARPGRRHTIAVRELPGHSCWRCRRTRPRPPRHAPAQCRRPSARTSGEGYWPDRCSRATSTALYEPPSRDVADRPAGRATPSRPRSTDRALARRRVAVVRPCLTPTPTARCPGARGLTNPSTGAGSRPRWQRAMPVLPGWIEISAPQQPAITPAVSSLADRLRRSFASSHARSGDRNPRLASCRADRHRSTVRRLPPTAGVRPSP